MIRSTIAISLCAALVAGGACSKEETTAGATDKPKPATATTTPTTTPTPDKPKAMTAEERVAWYKGCWDAFNKADWGTFEKCYAEDAESEQVDSGIPVLKGRSPILEHSKSFKVAFPDMTGEHQLVLVKGDWIFSVTLIRGTHAGPLKGPMGEIPATQKKIGYLIAHAVQVSDKGVAKDWFFADMGTMFAQIGVSPMPGRAVMEQGWADKPVVVAKGDQKEKDNEAVNKAGEVAFNGRDMKAFEALLADDVVWSEMPMPTDMDKKATLGGMAEFFKGFSDLKIQMAEVHGIGDWVVGIGSIAGTNDGDIPMMQLEKTGKPMSLRFIEMQKIENGKIKGNWLFYNGLAMASQLGLMDPAPANEKKGK